MTQKCSYRPPPAGRGEVLAGNYLSRHLLITETHKHTVEKSQRHRIGEWTTEFQFTAGVKYIRHRPKKILYTGTEVMTLIIIWAGLILGQLHKNNQNLWGQGIMIEADDIIFSSAVKREPLSKTESENDTEAKKAKIRAQTGSNQESRRCEEKVQSSARAQRVRDESPERPASVSVRHRNLNVNKRKESSMSVRG